MKTSIEKKYPEHKYVSLRSIVSEHKNKTSMSSVYTCTHTNSQSQIYRRRDIFKGVIARLSHRHRADMVRRPPRRHRELHTPIPHVLRLHRLHRRRQGRHRRHIRAISAADVLGLSRPRGLAQRDAAATFDPKPDSSAAGARPRRLRVLLRMGQG